MTSLPALAAVAPMAACRSPTLSVSACWSATTGRGLMARLASTRLKAGLVLTVPTRIFGACDSLQRWLQPVQGGGRQRAQLRLPTEDHALVDDDDGDHVAAG